MTEKGLFTLCGIWFLIAIILGIVFQDFWLFIHWASIPAGLVVGWAVVTTIEIYKGGKDE